jgi:hypothetical protein
MDARTLDATELLVEVYRDTGDLAPLGRLTRFATAQRQGLEVIIDNLPAGARPPARESIEILERVAERVTGIMGGCICPANPLLPGITPPDLGGDGTGTAGPPQAPACPCNEFRGEDDPIAGGPDGDEPPADEPPTDEPPTTPPTDDPDAPIDLPELPIVGDEVDDAVNDLIDEILKPLEPIVGPSPLPTISLTQPLGLGN